MRYSPLAGVFVGRPPCALCGAAHRLHHDDETCPEAYRAQTVAEAERELDAAYRSGDQVRVFIARGEVQRLRPRRPLV